MGIDLEQIRKNYSEFDDYKIEHLAKNEIGSLDPDVVAILKEEIKKRGLDSNLNKGIEAQAKELTESELKELKSKIKKLACPDCGQSNSPLIGTFIREVKSFIVFTHYKKTPLILCHACADRKRNNAMITTALLGWWGIPWGLFRTPHAIISSLSDSKNREVISDSILTQFALENVGELRTNWDKESVLVDFIRHRNQTN
ncbi:MAG TPA: hypothetical protein DEO70_02150 [Bacteroidales bacterium]|nr:MAG: hypothetical protein A2X11_05935 [Bacteroidetes bacterium GWE2_42_24]OFY28340.1 MAG: hypothetical protein A2X09_14645 [Bacteroidetes bacterium GWF2_43_11]HBY52454.1 hypothetical protein [Marinilabiliales bacterium]HBZ65610.1 hypothetical protein [Bacteroidales bacterium]